MIVQLVLISKESNAKDFCERGRCFGVPTTSESENVKMFKPIHFPPPDLKGPFVLYPKDKRIIIVDGEEKEEL